jgi:RNA polymerase sigma-54 factor
LINAIASRQDTLMKVVQAIAQKQQGFLEHGPLAMQAMTLREIAESIGMHESTVSRACTGKYLATPHGIFELGRLFRSGISDDSGQVQAASAIQARIAAMIRAESPQKPLSDARLESLLADQGLSVARRTIAKYREALQIPASSERRKPA